MSTPPLTSLTTPLAVNNVGKTDSPLIHKKSIPSLFSLFSESLFTQSLDESNKSIETLHSAYPLLVSDVNKAKANAKVIDKTKAELTSHLETIAKKVEGVAIETIQNAAKHFAVQNYGKGSYFEHINGLSYYIHQTGLEKTPNVYLAGEKLGEGVSSSAYSIHQLNTGKSAALKLQKKKISKRLIETLTTLHPSNSQNLSPRGIQRAPHYPEPWTFDSETEYSALVEDLCRGDVHKNFPKTPQEFRKFLKDISTGLFHASNLINHGDIKPENMLISDDGEYLLADWGSSKSYSEIKKLFQNLRSQFLGKSRGMSDSEKEDLAYKYVEDLANTYSPAYSSENDWDRLLDAFMTGDCEQFIQIEKSRDVFAFGASIIAALDPQSYYEDVSLEIMKEKGMSVDLFAALMEKGLSDAQVMLIDRMLLSSPGRPTAEEIYKAFR